MDYIHINQARKDKYRPNPQQVKVLKQVFQQNTCVKTSNWATGIVLVVAFIITLVIVAAVFSMSGPNSNPAVPLAIGFFILIIFVGVAWYIYSDSKPSCSAPAKSARSSASSRSSRSSASSPYSPICNKKYNEISLTL